MTAIGNRYEFVYLVDVKDGNPNGDPDADNMPRMDPESGQGLISDVCIKRKVRNCVSLVKEAVPGYGIYVEESSILNEQHRKAYRSLRPDDKYVETSEKLSPQNGDEEKALRAFMCENFFDVRTFGAVMSTGVNCGQVRGPVQIAFGRSIDPIMPMEIALTRMAATTLKEAKNLKTLEEGEDKRTENRTMGRKHIVSYGLYRVHGYISASLAAKTGFSEDDLEILWSSLENMLDHDRSASRGEMTARKLIVFKHASPLGNTQARKLFDAVRVERIEGDRATIAHGYHDYAINIDKAAIPETVELIERF